MNKSLTPLEIVRSQRDSLSVAYHELQIDHTLLKQSLAQTNGLLELARSRISELEAPIIKSVEIASDADTDAAA